MLYEWLCCPGAVQALPSVVIDVGQIELSMGTLCGTSGPFKKKEEKARRQCMWSYWYVRHNDRENKTNHGMFIAC